MRYMVAVFLLLISPAVAQTSSSDKPVPPTERAAAPSKPEPLNPTLFKIFGNYGGGGIIFPMLKRTRS